MYYLDNHPNVTFYFRDTDMNHHDINVISNYSTDYFYYAEIETDFQQPGRYLQLLFYENFFFFLIFINLFYEKKLF